MRRVLILGGARSGKSRYGQRLAQEIGGSVLFVATAEALDGEMERRIFEHRRKRPQGWRTLEAPVAVGRRIQPALGDAQVVLVDCVTLLVSNVLGQLCPSENADDAGEALAEAAVHAEVAALVGVMRSSAASFLIVSNEVGSGLVPENRLGRLYRDLLGRANQSLAEAVDEVYLMVAGLPVRVKPPGL